MSKQTEHRLTIVEVPQAARRAAAETSAAVKKSSTKQSRITGEGKSVKKRAADKARVSTTRAKVKPLARPVKSRTAYDKSARRTPMQPQPKFEMAVEPALPIEIDIPSCGAEQVQPQCNLAVEEIPAAVEPLAEASFVDDGFAIENDNNVHPAVALFVPESAGAEMAVIAEPQLTPAAETMAPSEDPIQSILLAQPQSIRRTFAFQWNVVLQILVNSWSWLQRRLKTQHAKKRLRVCESVSLGEKRFIAVVQVDGEQFLVGGSSSSVSTLAHLEQPREFSDVFRRYGQSGMQA